jgi:pimeloyl-ACP methyl ester carboxylesterase
MVPVGADKVWAEDSGGDGPVVVLLHPGVGDSRIWDHVWPGLTPTCRVIRYDVRGYGRSPAATRDYTRLGDLREVLRHFRVDRMHLVGCSMGGATSINFSLDEPGRVESLTLVCPGVSGYPWPDDPPELIAEFEALGAAGDIEGIVAGYQRMWAAAGASPQVLEQLRSAVRAEPSAEKYERDDEPAFDRLYDLRVPTVLMLGDLDRPVLIACDEEMARRIPGCRLIWMPGVDHLPPLREPALVTQTILDHIRNKGRVGQS